MTSWDDGRPWYHGSQQALTVLRAGSSISQNRDIARIFSHRPALLSMQEDGSLKHDGTAPGYLYRVAEAVKTEDIYPHPHPVNVSRWEWLTKRELSVQLIERTEVQDAEKLTEQEIAELRRKQQAAGLETFAE